MLLYGVSDDEPAQQDRFECHMRFEQRSLRLPLYVMTTENTSLGFAVYTIGTLNSRWYCDDPWNDMLESIDSVAGADTLESCSDEMSTGYKSDTIVLRGVSTRQKQT